MHVLVTGAAGRLGKHAVRQIRAAGHLVRATDRRVDRSLGLPIDVVDLREREACYRLVDGVDAIVHLGNIPHQSLVDEQTTYAVNTEVNFNVFRAAGECGVRQIVFASSVQVIGGGRIAGVDSPSALPYLPIDERTPANPGNSYALSKHAGELALEYAHRRLGVASATALRFPYLHEGERPWTPRGPGLPHHTPTDEGFACLPFADAARLIVALLAARPAGFSVHLPASRAPSLTQPLPDLVAAWYPAVPLRRPLAELVALVDCASIATLCGWTPSA